MLINLPPLDTFTIYKYIITKKEGKSNRNSPNLKVEK